MPTARSKTELQNQKTKVWPPLAYQQHMTGYTIAQLLTLLQLTHSYQQLLEFV